MKRKFYSKEESHLREGGPFNETSHSPNVATGAISGGRCAGLTRFAEIGGYRGGRKMKLKLLCGLAIAMVSLVGCVPSELVDVGGRGNPNADDSILPKEGANGKWGYVDRNDKWLIEPQYLGASGFTDNIFDGEAMVQIGDKTVYIDKSGKVLSEAYPNPQ